jgi:tRNA threonylcarbamoyladenosine biosynthesis protein TsaE
MEYITKNAKETLELGKKLASKLQGGETIGLIGNLGSGKTVFTKGVAEELGVTKNIASPTFVLWRLYKVPEHKKIKHFCHIDLYRLASTKDVLALGIDEFWQKNNTVCLIEWAEKIKKHFPKNKIYLVEFEIIDSDKRKIVISRANNSFSL